ncbi:MAG: TolC family protein [Muribaculaceae bacterium]
MKKLHLPIVLAAFALASLGAKAQTATGADTLRLSADDCVRIALSTNPTIKVADMEITRVSYGKNLTVAQLLPQVSFSGQYSRALALQTMYMDAGDGTARAIKMGRDNSYAVGFSAQVPIIAPQLWKSLKLNDIEIAQNVEAARSSRLQMVNNVQNAYYALLLALDSHQVLIKNYETAKFNAEIFKKKFETGTASEYDVLRSSVQVKNLEPSIIEAENTIRRAQLQLLLLMGVDITTPIKPTVSLAYYKEQMYDRTMSIDTSLDKNTSLRALDLQTDYLKRALEVQKMSWYPTLSGSINYMWHSMSMGSPLKNFKWTTASTAALSLSLPIFQGGTRYYKQRQAEVAYKEMTWQRDNLVRSLNVQVKTQMDNIQKNVKQISTNEAGVEQARKANQIMEKSFQIGAASYLDLRDSEVALLESELSYYQSIYNYLVAESELQLLLGTADVTTE